MTAQEYTAALRRIERDSPSEVLLPALRRGHSRANEMYLRSALKRVNPTPDPSPDGRGDVEGTTARSRISPPIGGGDGGGVADATLRGLWAERTRLFGEMNKQSNLFHSCKTDAERATNSARVLDWWNDILAVKEKIAYYEQHGELPPVVQDEGEELPENAALLAKKLNSLRARISQKKKQLVELAGLDPGTPGLQSKIDAAESDLKRLKFLEGMAVEKLKVYEQAA